MPTPPNPTQRGRASPSGRVSPQLSPQKAAEWESVFSNRANSEKEPTRLAFGSASPALRDRVNLNEPLMPANDFDDPTPRPSTAEGSTIGGPAAESDLQATIKALLYGLINCIVVTPVMIGFAAIIFRHHSFHRDPAVYAQLVKLVLFSSAVHQSAFTTFSSLPFAIGQVQDAGLIFLSTIAGEIADAMKDDEPEHMLATVLVALSLSTAALGVALMLTGYFQLAGLVQYLPLPVVGGYLAFIGLYCLEAGISLMSGLQVDSLLGLHAVEQWSLLLHPGPLYFCLPGVFLGIGILFMLMR